MDNETANIDSSLKLVQKKLSHIYTFIKNLGGGVFSNVYLVKDIKTEQEYALKVLDYHFLIKKLRKENRQDPHQKITEIKKRFIAEAKLYKKIHHPNIVKIHATGVIEDESKGIEIPFMLMDYIRGSSLSDLLKTQKPFTLNRTWKISQDVLHALEVIHRNNIIHRDIKPGNIMVENETGKAIIIDFGIAKDIVGGSRLTTTGSSIGTPPYMAPEQFVDSSKVDHTIDIYSFAIVLYEMLTGKALFSGINFAEIMTAHREKPIPDPRLINPQLPRGITPILNKALSKTPRDRYQSTGEFLHALIPFFKAIPTAGWAEKKNLPIKKIAGYLFFSIIVVSILILILSSPGKNNVSRKKDNLPHNRKLILNEKLSPSKDVKDKNQIKKKNTIENMKKEFKKLKDAIKNLQDKNQIINKYKDFLNKYRELVNSKPDEVQSIIHEIDVNIKQLQDSIEADSLYNQYIDSAQRRTSKGDFDIALEILSKAETIKDNNETKKLRSEIENKKEEFNKTNGKVYYEKIKNNVNLAKYRDFKKNFPSSIYLPVLIQQLKEKKINLPPEKYWNSIRKNKQGFYEIIFDDTGNYHCMIYIPNLKIWMDKYEVSNKQYRNFLLLNKRPISIRATDSYIHSGDEYPAVVTYADAESYCRNFNFRLPRLEEWEYAAGRGKTPYPWGKSFPGEQGIYQANFDSLEDEGNIEKDGFRGTAPVKSFQNFPSFYGMINMAGNVWEWVQGRILKGGSFISLPDQLLIINSTSGKKNDSQGFRCVKDEK